ncbi:hypothetical protein CHARACLAT_016330 [Characodon lateralis]|uniref:Uncharacterized protein n=1 Tax=Characodon lateralis TaxID=208331 RepID=A0ABU7E485_9TELE|nr:hypothetical protein [Characodon lateralis]
MEKEVKRHYRAAALNIMSSLCSVASIAFCVHLSISAADIRSRVVGLESGTAERTFIQARGYPMEDFNSLVQQRVDELLSQRSYENFAKIRNARQAAADCNCPPGKRHYTFPYL